MAISINTHSNSIEVGETKALELVITDRDGDFVDPDTMEARFFSPRDSDGVPIGSDETYDKSDFVSEGTSWRVLHTFGTPGYWFIVVIVTDLNGSIEKVFGENIFVQDQKYS